MSFVYRGLREKLERHIVTEEEIDRNLERLRQQNPRIAVIKDRPARLGDEVVLDYAGYCNGEQFQGGTAECQTLVLGSGMFTPGFEEQLVDKIPGEKVVVEVTFPEEYHAEDLAGKPAQFHCTIHEIREKSEYELDDVFAKEVGRCENLVQMRQALAESLQAYTDERGEMDLQDRLVRQAAQSLELTVTPEELEKAVDEQMHNLEAQLAQQGLNLEMYCKFTNSTPEALREDARPAAEAAIRVQAVIERVTILEGLKAEQAEIDEALQIICRRNNMTMEQLQPYYDEEFQKAVERSVLTTKVMSLIREAAIIE